MTYVKQIEEMEKKWSFSYIVPTPSGLDLNFSDLSTLARQAGARDATAIETILQWLDLYPQSRFAPRYDHLNWVVRIHYLDQDGVVVRSEVTRQLCDVWPSVISPAFSIKPIMIKVASMAGHPWTDHAITKGILSFLAGHSDPAVTAILTDRLKSLFQNSGSKVLADGICEQIINCLPPDSRMIDLVDDAYDCPRGQLSLVRKMSHVDTVTDVLVDKIKSLIITHKRSIELRLEALAVLSKWAVSHDSLRKEAISFIEENGIFYPNGPESRKAAQGYPEESFPHMGNIGLCLLALRPLRPLSKKIDSLPLWVWETHYHRIWKNFNAKYPVATGASGSVSTETWLCLTAHGQSPCG